jgi:hypothetical protein
MLTATWQRRRFLVGAGAGALSPFFAAVVRGLAGEAIGQESKNKRLLVYLDGQGRPDMFRPKATSATEFALGAYPALEPWKKDLLIVDGLFVSENVHLHGCDWAWTCLKATKDERGNNQPAGPTIDRVIGAKIGANDPYQTISVVAWKGPYSRNAKAADGPAKPVPALPGPFEAYERVLAKLVAPSAGDVATGESAALRLAADKSVLDFVGADLARLKTRLPGAERAKVDQYVESLRGLEKTLGRAQAQAAVATCSKPTAPDKAVAQSAASAERMRATLDFAISSLACALTHVLVVHAGPDSSLYFLGDARIGTHGGHGHYDGADVHVPYTNYVAENLAYLRSRLASIKEGNGSMADSTVLLYTDEHGGRHHNGYWNTWFMAVGGGGILPTGRFLKLPIEKIVANDPRALPAGGAIPQSGGISTGTPAATTFLGDFFTSLANGFGVDLQSFGNPALARGRLAALGG